MNSDSGPTSPKPYNSVAMRERRKKAGVVQISFYIREVDKQEAAKVLNATEI
ncbi:hypothetical protein [Devosia sp.]|uniref:hypothetical protein n=1 Tax=Devosia sp. TaxID=1871048 RepID=UPI002B00084B|nr:hypothetical protein [Devosia sp.]